MARKFMGVVLVCKTCGKEFKVPQGRKGSAKYCSEACATSHRHEKEKVALACVQCGEVFFDSPAHAERRKTCSKACDRLYKRRNIVEIKCEFCSKIFYVKASHAEGRRFCSKACVASAERLHGRDVTKGAGNPAWKGGRVTTSAGYTLLFLPEHPFASIQGYVLEHRVVVENMLRRLDPESPHLIKKNGVLYLIDKVIIHHINGDKADNRIENLEVMTSGKHLWLHIAAQNNGVPQGAGAPLEGPGYLGSLLESEKAAPIN